MCDLYSHADPALYHSRTRSLRLHGVVTTLRLEDIFWNILQTIARDSGLTLNQAITRLIDEAIERHGSIANTASFLRVCCLRYMSENPSQKSNGRS